MPPPQALTQLRDYFHEGWVVGARWGAPSASGLSREQIGRWGHHPAPCPLAGLLGSCYLSAPSTCL